MELVRSRLLVMRWLWITTLLSDILPTIIVAQKQNEPKVVHTCHGTLAFGPHPGPTTYEATTKLIEEGVSNFPNMLPHSVELNTMWGTPYFVGLVNCYTLIEEVKFDNVVPPSEEAKPPSTKPEPQPVRPNPEMTSPAQCHACLTKLRDILLLKLCPNAQDATIFFATGCYLSYSYQ